MRGRGRLGTLNTVSRTAVTGRERAEAEGAIPHPGAPAPADARAADTTPDTAAPGSPALDSALDAALNAALATAETDVEHHAQRLGLRAVELTDSAAHHRATEVLLRIWGNTDGPPLTPEMLRAFEHTGNYAAAVFDGDDMVAVAVAFRTDHQSLHSHIAGVLPSHQGKQVGYLLKLHQRAWALRHGIAAISWTFDPLVRRNAHFNLVKLGAVIDEYLPDFYGSMADAINAGIPSDRMVALWDLTAPVPGRTITPRPDAAAVLRVGDHDEPLPGPPPAPSTAAAPTTPNARHRQNAPERTIALPSDIEALRATKPETAERWRYAVREAVARCAEDGFAIVGFTPDGAYLARQEHDQ